MMVLVIGGSGSGKSAYAENYICSLSGNSSKNLSGTCQKYYLAAMQACDEEGRKRIARHQAQRQGKGFCTIEQPAAVQNALRLMEPGEKSALLECISNLTANEMFAVTNQDWHQLNAAQIKDRIEKVAGRIVEGVAVLMNELTHLVVVSNNVFEDGIVYDAATTAYLEAMGQVNERLAAMADQVVEVVAGIPVMLKDRQGGV